jgi:hypothetical protein
LVDAAAWIVEVMPQLQSDPEVKGTVMTMLAHTYHFVQSHPTAASHFFDSVHASAHKVQQALPAVLHELATSLGVHRPLAAAKLMNVGGISQNAVLAFMAPEHGGLAAQAIAQFPFEAMRAEAVEAVKACAVDASYVATFGCTSAAPHYSKASTPRLVPNDEDVLVAASCLVTYFLHTHLHRTHPDLRAGVHPDGLGEVQWPAPKSIARMKAGDVCGAGLVLGFGLNYIWSRV